MTKRVAFLTLLIVAGLAAPAAATPVKCAAGDITPGDRVFAEPELSVGFMRFDEFECGIRLLESQFPTKLAVTTFGSSQGGHPLYDIKLTNEAAGGPKRPLLIINSIHGNEIGGREGGARVIEDMVDARFHGGEDWAKKVLDQFVVHFIFPNPDGWIAGDVTGSNGASVSMTRGNANGVDLNRELPVKGWVDVAKGVTPEGKSIKNLLTSQDDWYLGTDNHGQSTDTHAAAGLQIVGQFDYQKSETLARFADGITETMKEYDFGKVLDAASASGQDIGPYHWGTLYDMLGYSASGSVIDYYNTPEIINGTGFATELTVGQQYNWPTYSGVLNNVWVNAIRAINYTMFKQAIDPKQFTYTVGGRAAYVFDPRVIASDDENGPGFKAAGVSQVPYHVTRMRFLADLNKYADHPLDRLEVDSITAGRPLDDYDSIVLANGPLPEDDAFYANLKAFVENGGNLIVTDQALKALPKLGLLTADKIGSSIGYVGFVNFANRTDALNQNLRGVASQTYDTVPIGYRFGSPNSAPNWTVERAAFEAAGGRTAGTNGTGRTAYGEIARGKGRIRLLGALLPDPTEAFDHRYGLQSYAVTYTGYTLLQNMLAYQRP